MGIICSLEGFVCRTSIFITILGFVLLGNILTARTAFTVIAIYNILNTPITLLFSVSMTSIAEVHVSIKRMQKFMSYEEITKEAEAITAIENGVFQNGIEKPSKDVPPRMVLNNVSAKWSKECTENTLNRINMNITKSQLVAVIGPVGSGKSSLFNVILKELPVSEGTVNIDGVLSYASQEAWLFNGSIRDNILFGEDYDEERYNEIIRVCALETDLDMFQYGDRTIVGEKGRSVSGGQKARINLARCVYKKADIYLLDDPLSAVDANVGRQLYDECIKKFLHDKICILSTHQLQYLKNADRIVIMDDGLIINEGTFDELQTSGLDFAKLLKEFNTGEEDADKRLRSREGSVTLEDSEDNENKPEVEKEFLEEGHVKAEVYKKYFRAGGNWCMILLGLAIFAMWQGVLNSADYFISYWYDILTLVSEEIYKFVFTGSTKNKN